MKICIFSIPKPFAGHIGVIQENALRSWKRLGQVLVFGDEPGIAEACERVGVTHVPDIPRNRFDIPLVGESFRLAAEMSDAENLVYVNGDILLGDDLPRAICELPFNFYLATGRRWNMDIFDPWPEEKFGRIPQTAVDEGSMANASSLDYFVLSRNAMFDFPPFAVGRLGWDNWMIYRAKQRHIPIIDMTGAVKVIHQNHDHSHYSQTGTHDYSHPENIENLKLINDHDKTLELWDADWLLTEDDLRRALTWRHLAWKAMSARRRFMLLRDAWKVGQPIINSRLFRSLQAKWVTRLIGEA